ncbi:MAG: hypothetical protein AB7F43_08030 [Bacteriovoracia bacterium]
MLWCAFLSLGLPGKLVFAKDDERTQVKSALIVPGSFDKVLVEKDQKGEDTSWLDSLMDEIDSFLGYSVIALTDPDELVGFSKVNLFDRNKPRFTDRHNFAVEKSKIRAAAGALNRLYLEDQTAQMKLSHLSLTDLDTFKEQNPQLTELVLKIFMQEQKVINQWFNILPWTSVSYRKQQLYLGAQTVAGLVKEALSGPVKDREKKVRKIIEVFQLAVLLSYRTMFTNRELRHYGPDIVESEYFPVQPSTLFGVAAGGTAHRVLSSSYFWSGASALIALSSHASLGAALKGALVGLGAGEAVKKIKENEYVKAVVSSTFGALSAQMYNEMVAYSMYKKSDGLVPPAFMMEYFWQGLSDNKFNVPSDPIQREQWLMRLLQRLVHPEEGDNSCLLYLL